MPFPIPNFLLPSDENSSQKTHLDIIVYLVITTYEESPKISTYFFNEFDLLAKFG